MKSLVKNFLTHGLTTWMVIQTFYAGLNFTSWNLLESAAGGTFMSTTLGVATKLSDDMMTKYSQWHTERSPTGRKLNSFEEISSLNEKVDLIMSLLTKQVPIDPRDVPLNYLVAQEKEQIDVNFISRINFNKILIGLTLLTRILGFSLPTTLMEILIAIPILVPKTQLLNLKICLNILSLLKRLSVKM